MFVSLSRIALDRMCKGDDMLDRCVTSVHLVRAVVPVRTHGRFCADGFGVDGCCVLYAPASGRCQLYPDAGVLDVERDADGWVRSVRPASCVYATQLAAIFARDAIFDGECE